MRFVTSGLLVLCMGAATVVVAQSAARAGDTLWYRGYFDGEVKIDGRGVGWYHYKPASNSAYPLFEQRYTSPWWYVLGKDDKDKNSITDSTPKVHTLYPLPGHYYFKQQPHYNFSTPLNSLGWPYRKYNNRY